MIIFIGCGAPITAERFITRCRLQRWPFQRRGWQSTASLKNANYCIPDRPPSLSAAAFHPQTAASRRRNLAADTDVEEGVSNSAARCECTSGFICQTLAGTLRSTAGPEANVDGGDFHQPQLSHGGNPDRTATIVGEEMDPASRLAGRFLNLAAADKGAFERLGRYKTALWRQVCQTVFMLEVLRRQSLDMKWLPRSPCPVGSHSFSLSLFPRR